LVLVERGVWVKASGFGRVDLDVKAALKDLYHANPEALMFGTDLPSTRAPRPFATADVRLIQEVLGTEAAQRVFYDNAAAFYRLRGTRP
jgi:predicted TIM-barrel fold metal-dependent hydrolase